MSVLIMHINPIYVTSVFFSIYKAYKNKRFAIFMAF